jgi:PAS domain S-box-containing protein
MTGEKSTLLIEGRVLGLAGDPGDIGFRNAAAQAGVVYLACDDVHHLGQEIERGAGALLVSEEALSESTRSALLALLLRRPRWSDLPVVLVTDDASSPTVSWAVDQFPTITVVERSRSSLPAISALRTAIKARRQQLELISRRPELLEPDPPSVRLQVPGWKHAEDAQSWLAAIVESSDDAIISKTLKGIITSWNAGAERLFGYQAEEAIGRPIEMIIPKERWGEEREILERLRRGERIEHFETVRVNKAGRMIDISLTISPVRNRTGQIVGVSKVARDISARKRAEEVLREMDRRKDVFLATLAHELRNPLAPIQNTVQLLRLAGDDLVPRQTLDIIQRQISHLTRLVDDLMDVSRINRGKIELHQELVELREILLNAVEISRPLLDAGRHHLSLEFPPEPISLVGDSIRLTQVIANLLNNAAKYTPPGGRILLAAGRSGEQIEIRVRDNGRGISPELLPRVFELFVQADTALDRGTGGLGIGLTLSQSLVQLHGGTLEATSAGLDQGSEFIVRLPGTAAVQRGRFLPATTDAGRNRSRHPTHNILVVDDSTDAANSLALLLRTMGHQVQLAYGGESALELARTYRPDVAVLDLAMPGMDGFELARRLRREPGFADLLLIALTGYGQEEDRRRTREAGFNVHFVKPADPSALEAVLSAR